MVYEIREAALQPCGLAVARRVVERHGGRVWAESAVGEEDIFHFTL